MPNRALLLFLLLVSLSGCKKAPEASERPAGVTPKTVAVDSTASAEAPPPPAVEGAPPSTSPPDAPPPPETEVGVNLNFINQIVADFCRTERRVPKDLNELVKSGYAQSLPLAPAGKKFVIDPKTRLVQLVSK